MPRNVAECNCLTATIREAPSIDAFKARLCSINNNNNGYF